MESSSKNNDDGNDNDNNKEKKKIYQQNNSSESHFKVFFFFHVWPYRTMTWDFLILCFMEDVKTPRKIFLCLFWTWMQLFRI